MQARESASVAKMWTYVVDSQALEARVMLDDLEGVDARTRELALVVIALAKTPMSDGDCQRLDGQLAQLAEGSDEIAARAHYLRARIYQIQLATPDYARAEELYRSLARRWPQSHWTQLGMVKLGLVKLYALKTPADPRARLAEVAKLLEQVTEPTLRRDLAMQMGWAANFYELPIDEYLPYLIAADRVGGMLGITPDDLMIQIGELSFRAGHLEQSRAYFERFLAEVVPGGRTYNVQQRLLEVIAKIEEGGPP